MKSYRAPLIAGIIFLVPAIALAQLFPTQIVPCNGPECEACHVVALAQNIINFLIAIAIFIAVGMFAYAGLLMVTAGGDTGKIGKARGIFTDVAIGFIILLAAWLIVDTVMKMLVDESSFGPWQEIQCVGQPPEVQPTPTQPGGGGAQPVPGCPTCVAMPSTIPTNGNPCEGGREQCVMRPEMAEALTNADLNNLGLQLSEGYPPADRSHQSSCHYNATCVDISYVERNTLPTGQQINTATTELRSEGLTPVYEVQTEARRQELNNAGVSNVIVVPTINREHFSVYDCQLDSNANACQ